MNKKNLIVLDLDGTTLRNDKTVLENTVNTFGYNQLSIEVNDTLYSNFDTTPFFGNAKNEIKDLRQMEYLMMELQNS